MSVRERPRHKAAQGHRPVWYRMREGHYVGSANPRITVSLEGKAFKRLAGLGHDKKRTLSALIREAVGDYLDRQEA